LLRRSRLRLVAGLLALVWTTGCPGEERVNSDHETAPLAAVLDARDLLAGDPLAAEAAFVAMLEQHPDSMHAQRGLQDARRRLLSAADHRALYQAAVDERPDDPVAWYLLGRAAIEDPTAARAAFDRAIELDPENPWAVAGSAYLHYAAGDIFGAVTVYEEGVRRAPRSAQMRLLLGNHYLELKLYIHAQRHLSVAHKLAPDDVEVQAALGKALLAMGEEQRAVELLEGARATEPRVSHVYPSLIAVYLRHGQVDEAEEAYRTGLEVGMAPDEVLSAQIRSAGIVQRVRREAGIE
jgi:tetratricopeptide (TPR) repeat protein